MAAEAAPGKEKQFTFNPQGSGAMDVLRMRAEQEGFHGVRIQPPGGIYQHQRRLLPVTVDQHVRGADLYLSQAVDNLARLIASQLHAEFSQGRTILIPGSRVVLTVQSTLHVAVMEY